MEVFVRTWSGSHINYADFRPEDVKIEDIAHALSMVCRFGGHIPRHYSVAEHSILVAHLVPDDLKLAALLHDATESYMGDMVAPLKRAMPDYISMEKDMTAIIAHRFDLGIAWKHIDIHIADMKALYIEARSFYGEDEIKSWGFEPEIVKWGESSSRDVLCYAPSPHDIEKQFMNAFLAYGGVK